MAQLVEVGSIRCYFESLSDPRHTRNRKHLLVDVIVIAVAAIVCGCDGPTAMHRWAVCQFDWLAQHLPLPNGIPSRDCICRVLIALAPGVPTLLPSVDRPGRADRPEHRQTSRRHRRQDLPRIARRRQGPGAASHRQCLGQRRRGRAGPGRHRRQIQRNHGHSAVARTNRAVRRPHHHRRDGLSKGHRRTDRRGRRRLCHRCQGQPTQTPCRHRNVLSRTHRTRL